MGLGYTQSKNFNLGYKYEGLNAGTRFPSFIQLLAGQDDPTARVLGLSFPTYDNSGHFLGDQTILGGGLFEQGYLLGQGAMTDFSFGAALEPLHNVFFGASGSYDTGHYTSDLQLSAEDVNDIRFNSRCPAIPPPTGSWTPTTTPRDKQYRGWTGCRHDGRCATCSA